MDGAGERFSLIEESPGVRETLLEAAGGPLRRLPPHGDITRCKTCRKLRLEERERFVVEPLLLEDFSLENGEAPIPLGVRRRNCLQRSIRARQRSNSVAALQLEPQISIGLFGEKLFGVITACSCKDRRQRQQTN